MALEIRFFSDTNRRSRGLQNSFLKKKLSQSDSRIFFESSDGLGDHFFLIQLRTLMSFTIFLGETDCKPDTRIFWESQMG